MGCIGMSYDDFCRLRPTEFAAVCKAYNDTRMALFHDGWERARTVAAITVQPHTKKKITPKRLLPLPWDNNTARKRKEGAAKGNHERMAAAFEKFGDTYRV